MTPLERLLADVPAMYDHLEDALLPGSSFALDGDERVSGGTKVVRPAPARLDVVDLRHKVVRGLRWWVDAVRDPGEHTRVGHDVGLMCRWLTAHVGAMAAEDQAELAANLRDWLHAACQRSHRGADPKPDTTGLPPEAAEQVVRVADAAKLLGCTVRTIQRRAERTGGMVRLGDVMVPPVVRCELCDLPVGTCPHR